MADTNHNADQQPSTPPPRRPPAPEPEGNEPSVGKIWKKVGPRLDRGLSIYDKKEAQSTPETSLFPFQDSKARCQKELNAILDQVVELLGENTAAGHRDHIRALHAEITAAQTRVVAHREQLLTAPAQASQNFVGGLFVPSRESREDSIGDEMDAIDDKRAQIQLIKDRFRERLECIGISMPLDAVDSFLLPVEDELVAMAAVTANVARLTEMLQPLVDATREAPAETRRYYGIYLLLVLAVDRVQQHYLQTIDGIFLPRTREFEQEAAEAIDDAKSQISRGGPREQLNANIAANRKTIAGCRLLSDLLNEHRRMVVQESQRIQTMLAAAKNSYRTMRVSFDLSEMIGQCEAAFRSIFELRLPPLRPFQGAHLGDDLHRLAEKIAAKES